MKKTFWQFAEDVATHLNHQLNMGGNQMAVENIETIAKAFDTGRADEMGFAYGLALFIIRRNKELSRFCGFKTV